MMDQTNDRRMMCFRGSATMALVAGTCASLVLAQPATVTRPPGTAPAGESPSTQPRLVDNRRPEQPSASDADEAARAAEKGAERADLNAGLKVQDGEEIELSDFTEPVELTTLVDYVVRTLGINVSIKGTLSGSVVFNAPVKIKKTKLLGLLDALLEQQGFTITYDPLTQFYSVHPVADVPINLQDGESATTRIFTTPNVRPSALKAAIDAQTGMGTGLIPGQQPAQPGARQYAYIDELGVIVATDTVRKLAQVESLIQSLLAERAKSTYIRLELRHVAAPVARDRALQLVGQSQTRTGQNLDPNFIQQQQMQNQFGTGARGTFDNLQDRLTIDPQDNALIFRGLPEEIDQVKAILEVIDVSSKLMPKKHDVGKAARPIAEIARQRGLGEVTQIADTTNKDPNNPLGIPNGGLTFNPDFGNTGQTQRQTTGGPIMVVDETRGMIVYYGTVEQQAALEALVTELKTDDDRVVFRTYKLKNAKANDVASLIMGALNNEMPVLETGNNSEDGENSSGTLGSFSNRRSSSLFNDGTGNGTRRTNFRGSGSTSSEDGLSVENAEDIFIVPDQPHNQLIVKAPIRDHDTLSKLITKLDLRRPQVYIEAKIVVVNWSDDLRLAFETQLINAGGTGGVFNTNFGVTASQGNVLTPKTVPGGSGLTAAIIKSDQVPIVMTALQTEVDGRILSTPQVLVDDNTKAHVKSTDKQPTTTTTIGSGGNPNTTTFEDYVEAGTELIVTPTISDGGYIRLDYEINLSSFTGTGSNGIPPPILENQLKASSVTIPSDASVVLGGLTFDSESTTSEGVPILKDIPIVGLLFQDLSKVKRKTTLYVFLTPRIFRDPNFGDQRLAQEGPQRAVDVQDNMPELKSSYIDVFERPRFTPADPGDPLKPREASPAEAPNGSTRPPPPNQPAQR